MRTAFIGALGLLIAVVSPGSAAAWSHAGRWGTASGGGGSWSAQGWRGGSASGGGGSWKAQGAYGGKAWGGGGSWKAKGAYGGTAEGGGGSWSATTPYHPYYHPPYYGAHYGYCYHPPTTVNVYGSSCSGCGGWSTAGAAAAGVVLGAAVASASSSNAYSAGYAAGAANPYPVGSIDATLPVGCTSAIVGGTTYYEHHNVWFKPSFGANGVYYRVVPAP